MRWKIAVPAVLMAVSLLLTQGNLAFAHEWWFVDEGTHAGEYHSFGLTNLLVVLGAAALVGLAVVFDRSGWSRKLDAFFEMAGRMVPRGQGRIVNLASITRSSSKHGSATSLSSISRKLQS